MILVTLAGLLGALTYALMPLEMDESPRRMAAIFVLAIVLWVTEAIPLFATGLVVLAAQVWALTVIPGHDVEVTADAFFGAVSNPIIFIFLGGFVLAKAVSQEKIDEQLAALLIRPFGSHPYAVIAGLMLVTGLFSMWMSNTATTAMMVAMLAPILRQAGKDKNLRRALTLAIPFGANIGGIGTPIGTPPNAIAMAQLQERGLGISFLQWMIMSLPLMLGGMLLMWVLLILIYRPPRTPLHLAEVTAFRPTRKAIIVYCTFAATIFLWLLGGRIGVPTAVAAFVPIAVLTATGVIGRNDFNQLDWATLMLIAGGIALGNGITASELDSVIMHLVPQQGVVIPVLAGVCCILAVVMSTVMSNTVACNIILPLALAIGMSLGGESELQMMAVLIAIGASFGMSLPISTPPNVIAYSTGEIRTSDLLKVGGITSIAVTIFIVLTGPPVIHFFLG